MTRDATFGRRIDEMMGVLRFLLGLFLLVIGVERDLYTMYMYDYLASVLRRPSTSSLIRYPSLGLALFP